MPAVRVRYASPFIPPEFIAAHGLEPQRIGARAATACHQGRCATAAGFDAALAGGGPAIVATSCDQMRRSGEDAPGPLFRFALPATWGVDAARTYRDELLRLSRFLVRHGGTAPGPGVLAAALLDHDRRRARLRAGCSALPARAAAAAIAGYLDHGAVPAGDPAPSPPDGRVPVALLGGPLADGGAVHDLVEAAGARVVLDGSEDGERILAAPADRRAAGDDPLGELVATYFLAIPDAFRRPDSLLFAWLERGIAERGVRAVVVLADPWCDLWRAAAPRLRDWGRVPVVLAEAGQGPGDRPRLATRIEALAEMLR